MNLYPCTWSICKIRSIPHSDSGVFRTVLENWRERKTLVSPILWHDISLRNKEVVMATERLIVRTIKEILRLKYEAKLSELPPKKCA